MKKKNICIVTGSRSEFGLLYWLLKKISIEKEFKTDFVVLGSHFDREFGNTVNEINNSKIKITEKIKIISKDFTSIGILKNLTKTIEKFSIHLFKKKYDLVIILGDRFETYAVAISSYFNNIPIAHIHGGEITYGSLDDGIRHSITKLSNFHFVANQTYKKRVKQLGEHPANIHVVGGLGIENIKNTKLLDQKQLMNKINIRFSKKNILITFHPETNTNKKNNLQYIKNILEVLSEFSDCNLFFTRPNSDVYNIDINKQILNFVKINNKNTYYFKSLGRINYLSLLKKVDCILGNSSSGIIEAPYLKTPTVNIGNRQIGRLMSNSVFNVNYSKKSIKIALKSIIYNKSKKIEFNNQYGNLDSSDIIIKHLKKINFDKVKFKKFHDL